MPTGYTYGVQEGKVTTLEEFTQSCARAFLWQARDSEEKDLRKLVQGTNDREYYEKELKQAAKEFKHLMTLDDAQWYGLYTVAKEEHEHQQDNRLARKLAEKAHYEAMLEKVRQWTPPSDKHKALKDFMIKQLEESLEFDCGSIMMERSEMPRFEDWKKYELIQAEQNKDRAYNELERVNMRDNSFTDWVDQLLESVKGL